MDLPVLDALAQVENHGSIYFSIWFYTYRIRYPRSTRHMTFDELVAIFRRWLLMPDDSLLRLITAACIAHHLPGDPVWLLILAPSGSGKTEVLRAFSGLAFIRDISRLTPKTLWSGHQAVTPLVKDLDQKVIVIKELGTMLSLNKYALNEVLGQLREIYDGYLTSDYGNGRSVVWNGRVGLVAAGVPMIERSLSLDSQLGERFLYFRPPDIDRLETARKSVGHSGHEITMRAEMAEAVASWWTANPIPEGVRRPRPEVAERIARMATWVTAVRSSPPRDHEHQIELSVSPESPGRLPKVLLQLASALTHIRGSGRLIKADYALVRRVAIDSAPRGKVEMIRELVRARRPMPVALLNEGSRVSLGTASRWAEDLWHVRVLERSGKGERSDPYLYRLGPVSAEVLEGTAVEDFD